MGTGGDEGSEGGQAGNSSPPRTAGVPQGALAVSLPPSVRLRGVSSFGRTRAARPVLAGAQRFSFCSGSLNLSRAIAFVLPFTWSESWLLSWSLVWPQYLGRGKCWRWNQFLSQPINPFWFHIIKHLVQERLAKMGFWRGCIWNLITNPCVFNTHFTQTSGLYHSVFVLLYLIMLLK